MKTNTILLTILILVIIGGGIVFFSGDNSQDKQSTIKSVSTLSSDKPLYDFGEIDIFGGKVTTEFMLTNKGEEDITILGGTTSCGCTEAELGGMRFGMHQNIVKDFIIPAGESRPLKVIYDPLAHGPSGIGLAQRSVFLKTNSSVNPEFEVRIKALVVNKNN